MTICSCSVFSVGFTLWGSILISLIDHIPSLACWKGIELTAFNPIPFHSNNLTRQLMSQMDENEIDLCKVKSYTMDQTAFWSYTDMSTYGHIMLQHCRYEWKWRLGYLPKGHVHTGSRYLPRQCVIYDDIVILFSNGSVVWLRIVYDINILCGVWCWWGCTPSQSIGLVFGCALFWYWIPLFLLFVFFANITINVLFHRAGYDYYWNVILSCFVKRFTKVLNVLFCLKISPKKIKYQLKSTQN